MGFFSSSTPQTADPGEMTKRSGRKACWDSRDILYGCLDKHNIEDPVKDDALMRSKCGSENKNFEHSCAESWVKYFKEKRKQLIEKERRIALLEAQGARPIDEGSRTKVTKLD